MIVEPIGIVALLAGVLCLACGLRFALPVLIVSTLLGSAAALILPAFSGANIQPAHLLLMFCALAALRHRSIVRSLLPVLSYPRAGFWFSMVVLYSAAWAYMAPRLFWGQTEVFGFRTDAVGKVVLSPLAPTSGNLTQTVYFAGDLICFAVICAYGGRGAGLKRLGTAILVAASANLMFAALDLATYATNTTELLGPIRNATYRLLSDAESIGIKRLVGSFSEASAFGFATLGYFAFSLQLWLEGVGRMRTALIGLLSFVALVLSTSSTAYLGLSAFLVLTFARHGGQLAAGRARRRVIVFFLLLPILAGVVTSLVLLTPALKAYADGALDTIFWHKLSSDSGIERTAWNTSAMANFHDTYGLGVGPGSLRASSLPVAVLASIGVPGGLLYLAFLVRALHGPPAQSRHVGSSDEAIRSAARSACIALLIGAAITSAFIDLGLQFFIFMAIACAEPEAERRFVAEATSLGPASI